MRVILMDMEFEKVRDHFALVEMNTTAAQEHVGEIERHIRTVKERARCIVSDRPFQFLHRQIVIRMIYFVVMMLNVPIRTFAEGGITAHYSPRLSLGKYSTLQSIAAHILGNT